MRFALFAFALAIAGPAVLASPARATDTFPGETVSGAGTIVRSNVGATSETGEPIASAPGNTMWYSWTAPSAGRLNVGTCNQTSGSTSTFDTYIRVFTGNTVSTLTSLVSNDDTPNCNVDTGGGWGSTGSIAVTAGTVYRIQVDGYTTATGAFLLHYGLAAINTAIADGSATEGGDTGAFTVRLATVPTANVTVTIGASSPASQCSFSPTSLTFTPTNWANPQTVTVTATNDLTVEGTHSCSPASISAGATGGYTGVTVPAGSRPTITIMDNDLASFSISKAQTSGPSPVTAAGQTIGYTITVANTSGAILTGLSISDALTQAGSPRTLTSGPTYASGDTDSDGQIDVYETWTYSASYTATQSDIDNGGNFSNTATFDTAQTAPSTSATATTAVTRTPAFTVVKAQTSGPSPLTASGQTIGYTITVDNSGNITLTGLSISDALLQAGSPRTLTAGPTFASGDTDSDGQLDVTETWTYSASYSVTQSDIDNGGTFTNTATFDTAQTAPSTSAAATTTVTQTPVLVITKTADAVSLAGDVPVGHVVSYTYTVSNTGNVTISNVTVSDDHNGLGTLPLPGSETGVVTTNGSTDGGVNGSWDTLRPGDQISFSATYSITQDDVDQRQ